MRKSNKNKQKNIHDNFQNFFQLIVNKHHDIDMNDDRIRKVSVGG